MVINQSTFKYLNCISIDFRYNLNVSLSSKTKIGRKNAIKEKLAFCKGVKDLYVFSIRCNRYMNLNTL